MMNQNKPTKEINAKGEYSFRDNISNFVKGLESYIAVVSINIFWFVILVFIFDRNSAKTTELLTYLFSSILLLIIYSVITTKTKNKNVTYIIFQVIKRFFDVVVSASSFFFFIPVLFPVFIAVKLESPGPVFYKYIRVGQFGRRIDVYKIRTTYYEPRENPVTRVGYFLRRYSLNELPMLINVLTGELSLVGPSLRSYENLTEILDKDKSILEMKPGLTGLAQISNDILQQRVKLDLEYIENWSLLLDLKIIIKTLLAIISSNKT